MNSYALQHDVKPIVTMVTNIAKMFRYTIEGSSRTVPLRWELEHLRSYLRIQAESYPGLAATIAVDDSLADNVWTVGLTLQPIVENSFVHGYGENTATKVSIEVRAARRDEEVTLSIVDRGVGMPPDVRERYNALFAGATTDQIISTYRDVGKASIGLLNVHTRLRLTFGEPFGLWIARSDSDGTEVCARLPWREEECTT